MQLSVIRLGADHQLRCVHLIPVDVMHYFVLLEPSSENPFCHEAMDEAICSLKEDLRIALKKPHFRLSLIAPTLLSPLADVLLMSHSFSFDLDHVKSSRWF